MSALGAAAELAGSLVSGSAAGPSPVTVDDLVPILRDIEARFGVIADVFNAADSAATAAVTAATNAATQIEVIGQDVKDTTDRITDTIIPHSLSWLSGYLVSHFIAPLQQDVANLKSQVSFLLGWRDQIDSWRHQFVDPNVELWVGFRQFFDGWPQSILFMWHDWLQNPSHFAEWATDPLVGPIIAYLADPAHKQSRDNLTDIMAQAWREDSSAILADVYAFLLADT